MMAVTCPENAVKMAEAWLSILCLNCNCLFQTVQEQSNKMYMLLFISALIELLSTKMQ